MTPVQATKADRGTWRELLAADGDALLTQTPEWVDALCDDGGYEDVTRMYETAGGRRLVLPMVRKRGPWPASHAFRGSMPHACGMGGLVAESRPQPEEMAAIAADLAADPALRTGVRPNPLHGDEWAGVAGHGVVTIPRRAHVIDLTGGEEAAWKALAQTARRAVRKAERSGLEVRCSADGTLVPAFYELLEQSVVRWAATQHEPVALARWRLHRRDPLSKFEALAARLGEAMKVWVTFKDGAPAAATVVLVGANASYTRGAMDKELAGPARANDLLQWLAIQDACRTGCRAYHMGESGASRSLARFKEKFGARPYDYRELRFERRGLSRMEAIPRTVAKRLLRFRDV